MNESFFCHGHLVLTSNESSTETTYPDISICGIDIDEWHSKSSILINCDLVIKDTEDGGVKISLDKDINSGCS